MATPHGIIKPREIVVEMQDSYLDYAMSVIVARALPDVRDGFKPVHRRILYAMHEMGLRPGAKYQKSAKVVGYVLGQFHPHGDTAAYDSMVRMAQDFSLRYPLVDGQGNFGCFTGDTKVALIDGRNLAFRDLVKESQQGKKNYTFTFNHTTNAIEITEIHHPRLTKKKAQLVEVVLDNGEKLRCTPDHRFMMRDGSYTEAQHLEHGDSLMPLYDRLSTPEDDAHAIGYRMIFQPFKDAWDWAHRIADAFNIRQGVYTIQAGTVRHHVDINKLNNNPDNIRRMQWKDHWKLHYELASERHRTDPEYVAKLKQGRDAYWIDPEHRQKHAELLSERNKQWWQEPEYRARHIEAVKKLWQNSEFKEMMREASSKNLKNLWKNEKFQQLLSGLKSKELKQRWQDREYRAHMTEVARAWSKQLWSQESHWKHISTVMKQRWANPEYKNQRSKKSKALWQDAEYRKKFPTDHFHNMAAALWRDPDMKVFHAQKIKEQWKDPNFMARVAAGRKVAHAKRFRQEPDYMVRLTEKAKTALIAKWQDPIYKQQVIRSRILGFVHQLLADGGKVTPQRYESSRTNNGIPRLDGALRYFSRFSEIIRQARTYNHQIRGIRRLSKREDVYDLTIQGTHNFALASGVFVHNSIDGDGAAAYRYTEARLAPIAELMLADIEKETVNFADNFDGSTTEPTVLPTRIPNLLLNGSLGIAVGMTTNIPPHNLGEIFEALIHLIEKPQASVEDLMQFVKGPDFPTGGIIYGEKDILTAYATGKGPIVMRGKAEIVESEKRGYQIIISEIPYQVNKAELIVHIAELVKDKKLMGIKDIRDESDKDGLRIAIDLKQDAFPKKVLNQLYSYTELQKSFHVNMIALVDGLQPQILGLKPMLEQFLKHRTDVVTRRSQHDLRKAKERAHILEGLSKALDHIDEVVAIIKKSASREDAAANLIKRFKFSDAQTAAILDMRLQTLAGLERKKIEDELKEKKELIASLEDLLAHPKKILVVVKKECEEIKQKYGDARKTQVMKNAVREIGEEELIPEEESLFMITYTGTIKRIPPTALKAQKRGGKGLIGIATKEEDVVSHFFIANTHDDIMFFTNSGKVFQTKGYDVPESSRQAKGKALVNFLQVAPTDRITAVVPIPKGGKQAAASKYLFMTTAQGIIKKIETASLAQIRRNGMLAIKLHGDDELKWVRATSGSDEIILTTSDGSAVRFKERDVRPMGRAAAGVIGIRLEKGATVVGADVISLEAKSYQLLVVMANGYGKRTKVSEYKVQKRGGKGMLTAKITAKTGELVSAHVVGEGQDEEIIAVSRKGVVIRTALNTISVLGRATQGVRIMKLEAGDKVASVVVV